MGDRKIDFEENEEHNNGSNNNNDFLKVRSEGNGFNLSLKKSVSRTISNPNTKLLINEDEPTSEKKKNLF